MVRRTQLTKLVIERNRGSTISMCAMKAGVSRKTASKYLKQDNAMEQRLVPHTWRTREDPLEGLWPKALEMLRDHPDALPRRPYAPMKCMAYRELRRWLPAIRAAKTGGIRIGRYPGAKRISPAYTHSLIEAGDEIEALKILGKHQLGEPAYYDWLRGLALYRAGDREQAASSFQRYFAEWPSDIIGATRVTKLYSED